jgi:hypothetical protein
MEFDKINKLLDQSCALHVGMISLVVHWTSKLTINVARQLDIDQREYIYAIQGR